jgi:SAM-dependent methyltransferase
MCPDNKFNPSRSFEKYVVEFNALPFERVMEKFRRRKLVEIVNNQDMKDLKNVLEIGPGYNSILDEIHSFGSKVIIEPLDQLFSYNKSRYIEFDDVTIYNEDIQQFSRRSLIEVFDLVILSSVLHEFSDVKGELSAIIKLMKKDGRIVIVVPNNQSAHRQFGVTLGLLESTSALTNTEKLMQQNQNYSIEGLDALVSELGLTTKFVTTSFVKPHTHSQMQDWIEKGLLDDEQLESLYNLSDYFHPFNSEIFLLASKI